MMRTVPLYGVSSGSDPKSAAEKRQLAPRLVRMPDAAPRTERTRVTNSAADRNQG